MNNRPARYPQFAGRMIRSALVLAAIALLISPAAVTLAAESTHASDGKCLKCHSRALKKSLENGEKLSLQVTAVHFEESVHAGIGCVGCHEAVTRGKHPSRQPISNARDYAIEQNQACQ